MLFFDLGGHSLVAVRLFLQIGKTFGKNLPMAALFEARTIEQLAKILDEERWSASWPCLVPVQPRGSKTPFFFVPGAAENVASLAALASHLGSDQPFYGLQPQGLDGTRRPHTQVEDMATQYIREIQAVQKEGPYLLGGRCFGGLVAFEMARQLRGQGCEVPLLVLVDSSQAGPRISLRDHAWRLVSYHFPRGQLVYCLLRDVREQVKKLKRKLSFNRWSRRLYRVWQAHARARRDYVPKAYPGRITLIQSEEFMVRMPDYEGKWSALAEGGVVSRHARRPLRYASRTMRWLRGRQAEPLLGVRSGKRSLDTCGCHGVRRERQMTDALKAASAASIGILLLVTTHVQADDMEEPDKGMREPTTMRVYWKEGLCLDSMDERFQFRIGARLANDWAWASEDEEVKAGIGALGDGVEFREIQLSFEGTIYGNVELRLHLTFADGGACSQRCLHRLPWRIYCSEDQDWALQGTVWSQDERQRPDLLGAPGV